MTIAAVVLLIVALLCFQLAHDAWLYGHANELFWLAAAGVALTALGGWGVLR